MLQAPALETRAAIREHGDHVVRLDADVTLLRLSDDGRCGCDGLAPLCGAGSRRFGRPRDVRRGRLPGGWSSVARRYPAYGLRKRLGGERLIHIEHEERE